jgi:hypothetical protein
LTTSGTATFNVDVITALEEAFERGGRPFRSGYDYESAIRSMNLMFVEWANMGLNMWTLESLTVPTVIGVSTYTLAEDTVDIVSLVIGVDDSDYRIERSTFDEYAAYVNKTKTGRPTQYFVERRTAAPRVTVWPVPDKVYSLKIWRMRRIQDAGTAANTLDVPFRFLQALIAGVALAVAKKNPTPDMQRIQMLTQDYQDSLRLAQGEDRDRSSFYLRVRNRRA